MRSRKTPHLQTYNSRCFFNEQWESRKTLFFVHEFWRLLPPPKDTWGQGHLFTWASMPQSSDINYSPVQWTDIHDPTPRGRLYWGDVSVQLFREANWFWSLVSCAGREEAALRRPTHQPNRPELAKLIGKNGKFSSIRAEYQFGVEGPWVDGSGWALELVLGPISWTVANARGSPMPFLYGNLLKFANTSRNWLLRPAIPF